MQKLEQSQRQHQQVVNQAVAQPVEAEAPEDLQQRQANFHKINEIIQSKRHQRKPNTPVVASNWPTSKPKKSERAIDFSDLLTRLSLQKMRLGWGADQLKAWFIKQYGVTSDRLPDDQLLDAVENFEALAAI